MTSQQTSRRHRLVAARLDDRFEDDERVGGSISLAFFKILIYAAHGVGNMGEAKDATLVGRGESVKRSSFHLHGKDAFSLGGLYRVIGFPKRGVCGPGRPTMTCKPLFLSASAAARTNCGSASAYSVGAA